MISKPQPFNVAAVLSRGVRKIPQLQEFLPECRQIVPLRKSGKGLFDAVVGWGHKETASLARRLAAQKNVPYLALEDGFLRSMTPGVSGSPPLSVVVDDIGIYYDANAPSRLEQLLENGGWETPEILDRARRAIDLITANRLSKYNHAPLLKHALPGNGKTAVLVIDQTFGDASVANGMADADTFNQMLAAALAENPQADIIIKTHPDVLSGKKRGYLTHINPLTERVYLLAEEINPLSLIEAVDRVYTVTSQMGFEALLLGKPVECFGMPFYAGWGLTIDQQKIDRRTRRRTLEELFAAAYLLYPRYLNPFTNQAGTLEDVLMYLTLQVTQQRRLGSGNLLCSGFHWWKRRYLRKILQGSGAKVRFGNGATSLKQADKLVVWGDGARSGLVGEAQKRNLDILRIEDGFLRSVGLGSNLARPLSLVMDGLGIYFDPSKPSTLEVLLGETQFSDELCDQARALRERIVTGRFSKYNVGDEKPLSLSATPGQVVILVPGQVEDDASIRSGCVDVCKNLELLAEVRKLRPEAYIVYKPHPDVMEGNRKGELHTEKAQRYCDLQVSDCAMPACLAAVDEVHTMTSLTGFEALLHGKPVSTYGLPFYAGWGLTNDRHTVLRRRRVLTLDELVAATLILYPSYYDWQRGCYISAEMALDQLTKQLEERGEYVVNTSFPQRWWCKIAGFLQAFRDV